ncbi:hypothetical protein [Azohydromonas aeria]|uniref:hypothetical protein n=1 Tax=Azohydromonas aeria TaxID=2590212 RepID=UPI0012F91274|nr:hypothetical protein [Azohydromonas aeria]
MQSYETPLERARRRVIEAERQVTAQLELIAELSRAQHNTAAEWAELQDMCKHLRYARAELDGRLADGEN